MPEPPDHGKPRDDLAPFVSHVVSVPGVTREPIPLDDLLTEIIPYRSHRRALGVVSLDQYEAQLLRLCAGEGGYARLLPHELSDSCRRALEGPDPGLAAVPGLGGGRLVLLDRAWNIPCGPTEQGVSRPLPELVPEHPPVEPPGSRVETSPPARVELSPPATGIPFAFIPEEPARTDLPDEPVAPPPDDAPDPPAPVAERRPPPAPGVCPSCRFVLPDLESLRFCPGCGAGVAPAGCPGCGQTVLPAWRHCPSCGHRLGSAGLA